MRNRQQSNNKGHYILTLLLIIFCLVATNLNVGLVIQNAYGSSLENLEVASKDAENTDGENSGNTDSQDFNNGGGFI
jgi:hypothetical protein